MARMMTMGCFAAAFLAAAGCSRVPDASEPASQPSSTGRGGTTEEAFPFDRHARGGEDPEGAPFASGSNGRLGYAPGCLFLEQAGGRTGLVMPRDARFDGKRVTARNLDRVLGEFLHLSGRLLPNPGGGSYGCQTPTILIVDPMSSPPASKR
jgi:hypothetical protein